MLTGNLFRTSKEFLVIWGEGYHGVDDSVRYIFADVEYFSGIELDEKEIDRIVNLRLGQSFEIVDTAQFTVIRINTI